MAAIFNEILYRPILNFLVFLYGNLPGQDFGVAIIVLTVLVRVIFMPLSVKALRSQKIMSQLQPKIKEIQEKYKNDKAALAQATMLLYKENKVNPVAGCLPLLIQIPVLFALYKAFADVFKPESLNLLYGFLSNPGSIKNVSFGFLDLAKNSPVLAILAGVLQFFQSKISLGKNMGQKGPQTTSARLPARQGSGSFSEMATSGMGRQMLYFFPVMIIIIGWKLPAGLVLYWAVTTLFSVFEQFYVNKKTYVREPKSKFNNT